MIKCSLEKSIMILQVLNRESLNWTSYHSYKDNKTQISFGWEDDSAKKLWIKIGNYSKMLNFAQTEILKYLMKHIFTEKIEHATSSNNNKNAPKKQYSENSNTTIIKKENNNGFKQNTNFSSLKENNFPKSKPKSNLTKDMSNLPIIIQGETDKALLINFNSGKELWIPKSTIHGEYNPKKNFQQEFLIDNWILKKNEVLS